MGRKIIDLTGQKFGRLTVVERTEDRIEPSGKRKIVWKCQCECGNITKSDGDSLRSGNTKSCGCMKNEKIKEANSVDLTGQKFGRLTAIQQTRDSKNRLCWHCICDCGNECNILTGLLTTGHTKSCGCLQKDITKTINYNKLIDLKGKKFGQLTVIKRDDNYIDSHGHQKTKWICKCDCGNLCSVSGADLRNGMSKSCGCARISSMEFNVKQYFEHNAVVFYTQYKFDNLVGVNNGKLSYDFYLPQYNVLVECQGIQHYEPIEYFGGEEQFKIQQEHDKRKREYAEKNGYKLLEIWYYDYDKIEEILSRELELD